MYAANEILFPPYLIPKLREKRGQPWRSLVDRVAHLPEDHPESLAFSLMMIRLDGCMDCETDSYRAMRGCQACAEQMLRRYKGRDEDLLSNYDIALSDIRLYMSAEPLPWMQPEEAAVRAA